jgi:hypothetical protein
MSVLPLFTFDYPHFCNFTAGRMLINRKPLLYFTMRRFIILLSFLFAGIFSYAQKKTTSTPVAPAKAVVSATATTTSFESTLVAGNLSFIKTFQQGDGKGFVAHYSLAKTDDASFNNRKPIQISLSRQSFDSVFTKTSSDLAGKWNQVNKYIESNKILLSDEKGWMNVINYFNSL